MRIIAELIGSLALIGIVVFGAIKIIEELEDIKAIKREKRHDDVRADQSTGPEGPQSGTTH